MDQRVIPTAPAVPRLNKPVFISSATLILALGTLTVIFPTQAMHWLGLVQDWVSEAFGWYYMVVMVAVMVFVFWLGASRYGTLRLGHDDDRPTFSYGAWTSMLFSSGIGIALVYYGAYEPLDHFLLPPEGEGGSAQAARRSMEITFLHWGLHGWALYALMGVVLGYFAFRRGLPLALRSPLHALFGERIHGPIGHVVDGFGILATLVSMVTNLGIGALVLMSGLHFLFPSIPQTPSMLVGLVLVMMVVATIAAITGVEKGIALLSHINVRLLCLLLLFVFVCGPTLHLFDGMVQNVGDYLTSFVGNSFDLYVYSHAREWLGRWTLFYWAWWIAWAPFVGMFIARISRGRTIRELVIGVMLIPLGFTLAWLSIFGNTAIDLVMNHDAAALADAARHDPPLALYELLNHLPATRFIAAATVLIGFVLFLTPVDSGTLMIASLCTTGGEGEHDAPIWLRVFWAVATTVVTIGLLYSAGNFDAMQTAVVLCGLPFSVVLLLYMRGLQKSLHQEYMAGRAGA
ncbi:BCCT family transporter [Dyella sp.]|uniref:BCCT family transporter n=1 Tax=Dyella sp. TaxID=1869338 RepID=UPI002ED2D2E8